MNRIFCDSVFNQKDVGEVNDESELPLAGEHSVVIHELYHAYRQDLLLHLRLMVKDRHIAEELLHDTFVRLSKVPALDVIKKPRPFLLKIASNLALDFLRQQKKQPIFESDDVATEVVAPLPEHLDVLLRERQEKQLRDVIADLPPRARQALMLAKFKEMTLKEVAKEMEISQTMVEKHLKSAMQKCRTALRSETH